jgi:hypothetical protein
MAFAARVADPAVGGTYMTFINTLSNLGNMWPRSFTLWCCPSHSSSSSPSAPSPSHLSLSISRFVDLITWKECAPEQLDVAAPVLSAIATFGNSSMAGEDNVCFGTEQVKLPPLYAR